MIARVRKNDIVHVISGKNKGKQGSVIAISPKKGNKEGEVMVKGIAIATRHVKPRRAGEPGGIRKEESFIDMSQVMPVCSSCKKPSRVNAKMLDTGRSARVCNRCKEIF
ncbi:MAG TPA: 50S ribosomal protein L24 [Candidatus Babeliales bacterium]|jgi:large subunit ribosomal protein L24|nr:50S ribosomal protein L24 [Candidatus Babeliales bacterium]